ncbi:uncharacterized protein LOC106656888 [Trichogramma pretiosum]|uniref:uncharacterized protein LOC106656888 n=1 Tax=Trichogramma pretiosum TaxID=7493 RepID=UPI000C7189A1|nr:uncharacterized protein LOC106656888 [Trichogramma pretiosum]
MKPKLYLSFCLLAVVVGATDTHLDITVSNIISTGFDLLNSIRNPIELFNFVFRFVQDISDAGTSSPSQFTDAALHRISDKLEEMSEDIQDFRDELFEELRRREADQTTTEKLDKFFEFKEKIDDYFETFKRHINSSTAKHYLPSTKDHLIQQIRSVGYNGVTGLLQEMHALVGTDRWSPGSFNLLADDKLLGTLVCSRGRPQQLIIYNVFLALCATEIKGITLDVYAIDVSSKKEGVENPAEFNDIKQAYVKRLNKAVTAVRRAMSTASRSFWDCSKDEPEEGVNYIQFGRFLQRYIEREENLDQIHDASAGGLYWDKCKGGCERHEYSVTRTPAHRGGCEHRIRNCETFDQKINVCYAEPGQPQRYEYVESADGNFYGSSVDCGERELSLKQWRNGNLYDCEICLCTCDEPKVHDHFIDLHMVRANAKENEVIVGLRFRMKLGLLFMEAKVAKLLPSGQIDVESQIWKRKKFTAKDARRSVVGVDHLQLGWENRSFVLDDVELGNDYALTGVRFVYKNGFIKLAARGHKYNFKRGRINPRKEKWIVSGEDRPNSDYEEFSVEDRAVPTDYRDNKVDSSGAVQYVNLTTSGMKSDVGQSLVPFVDTVPVVTKQLIPLAGFGLIHKGNRKSAGYLALKLIGYDFTEHVALTKN